MSTLTGVLIGGSGSQGLMTLVYIVDKDMNNAATVGLITIILALWGILSMLNDIRIALTEDKHGEDGND